jgi:adenylate kinase
VELGLLHLSTGDALRAAVAAGTELGAKAKGYMDRGDLVPDGLIVDLVAERLQEDDCADGVLFDGFPRTLPQAEALSRVLVGGGRAEPRVLAIEVPEAELVRRLSGRRTCRACAHIFHVDSLPAGATACPDCGGELYQRADDSPEPVGQRLQVYARQTAPLLEYYEGLGVLVRVDGAGAPEEVAGRALAGLRGREAD